MPSPILIEPIVTEKLTRLMEKEKQYAFRVAKNANKIQIKKAVEERYPHVEVDEVRTMIVRGKRKRQFTRRGLLEGKRASYKKAIVSLKSGEIDFYEAI
jgi:large subunit ribosomal protein L23